jgi:hypothetical protein
MAAGTSLADLARRVSSLEDAVAQLKGEEQSEPEDEPAETEAATPPSKASKASPSASAKSLAVSVSKVLASKRAKGY